MSLPIVTIIGNINRMETKFTASGKQITTFQIECSEKNSKGEWENLYIKGECWEKQAEFVNNHFNDGDLCIATGKLVTEVYENRDGKKVYTIKLKFPNIEFAPKSKNSSPQPKQAPKVTVVDKRPKHSEIDYSNVDIPDDDVIPF